MYWEVEPRDPIIVGDGRLFSTGGRSESLRFPFPTTIAGAVRTRKALKCKEEFSDELLKIGIQGPLLYREGELLVVPPADAVVFDDDRGGKRCVRLAPIRIPDNSYTNMPDGLIPVGMIGNEKGKPSKNAPKYWRWAVMERWLRSGTDCLEGVELGDSGPMEDMRTGVSISEKTKAAVEGQLFQRKGLDFGSKYTMVIKTEAELDEGYAPLGGDRRIVLWKTTGIKFPELKAEVRKQVVSDGHCRLVFLTPAYFEDVYRPKGLGIAEVVAVANGRYQTISGWDLKKRRAKASRRLIPAGSVYFLRLNGGQSEREEWLNEVWFKNVSDGEQNRRDGLGLAAIGVWSGKEEEL